MTDPLRAAYLAALDHPDPDAPPVDMDRVVAAVAGESDPDETLAVLDLVSAHRAWGAAWQQARTMLALQHEAPPETPSVAAPPAMQSLPRPQPALPRPANRAWIGVVAALAAGVLAAVGVQVVRSPDEPAYRDATTSTVASQTTSAPRSAFELRWSAVPAGSDVRVQVFDAGLAPIDSASGLELRSHTVPAGVLTMPVGSDVLWRLRITPPTGSHFDSPTFRTRVDAP